MKLSKYSVAYWLAILFFVPQVGIGQTNKKAVQKSVEKRTKEYEQIAKSIWNWAEVGYQEEKSSGLLKKTLSNEGFSIESGVAEIPTAFVAEYGSGKPTIGILAEFDALPGISQEVATERKPIIDSGAGHACGHHLFGTASTAAAIAVKDYLKNTGQKGTIRLYGTPAEEGGSGKVYMVRAGLFDDVDVVLHWHASDRNAANPSTSMANRSAKFRFHGYSAHAAGAPEKGRSSLDAVEAMNHMVNLMREHVPDGSRIHYVITRGGHAPNVVPDYAEVFYYVRDFNVDILEDIWARVIKTAEGPPLERIHSWNTRSYTGTAPFWPTKSPKKLCMKTSWLLAVWTIPAKKKISPKKSIKHSGHQTKKFHPRQKFNPINSPKVRVPPMWEM